jgi:hypothetical protein
MKDAANSRLCPMVSSDSRHIKVLVSVTSNLQGNGPIRHVETCPDYFFTARVHTTKSTVNILAANMHCKYSFLYAEPLVPDVCTTLITAVMRPRELDLDIRSCITLLENLMVTTVGSG